MTIPAPHALRLSVGAGAVVVAGLDEERRERIRADWCRCAPADVDARDLPESAAGAEVLSPSEGESWDAFHEHLVYRATAAAIEAGRGTRLMLHAAALADPATGAALAMTAASGTGKTTATRVLGRSLAYLTDETAVIDPDTLALTPYAKPLSVLGPSGRRPKSQQSPDALGLGPAVDASLHAVALLDRVREGEEEVTARAEALPLAEAIVELAPQSSSLALLERGLVTLCTMLDRLGGAVRLVYREAEDLVPVVRELLTAEREPLPGAEWRALDPEDLTASTLPPGGPAPADDARWSRCAVQDGVHLEDGRLALLHGQELTVLDGLGPALWSLLAAPATAAGLEAALAAWGPVPADGSVRMAAALEAMRERGLLRLG